MFFQGYDPGSVARCWTIMTAAVCNVVLDPAIPELDASIMDHQVLLDEFITTKSVNDNNASDSGGSQTFDNLYLHFKPDFLVQTKPRPGLVDQNTSDYLISQIATVQSFFQTAIAERVSNAKIQSETLPRPLSSSLRLNVMSSDNVFQSAEPVDAVIENIASGVGDKFDPCHADLYNFE